MKNRRAAAVFRCDPHGYLCWRADADEWRLRNHTRVMLWQNGKHQVVKLGLPAEEKITSSGGDAPRARKLPFLWLAPGVQAEGLQLSVAKSSCSQLDS